MKDMTDKEIIEESLLLAADKISDEAKEQGTKAMAGLFKTALLKQYKAAFDQEVNRGEVHAKNIDKAVDFCYEDLCVSIRLTSEWSNDEKESLIKEGKKMTGAVRAIVCQILTDKGIKVV